MKVLEKLRFSLKVQLVTMMSAVIGMISLGTVAYRYLEDWTWAQCFYFSVMTLTTVGYGDLHPTTDASRMFTAAFVLVGVGVMLGSLTTIAMNYLKLTERQTMLAHEKRLKKRGEKHLAPIDDEEN